MSHPISKTRISLDALRYYKAHQEGVKAGLTEFIRLKPDRKNAESINNRIVNLNNEIDILDALIKSHKAMD